MMNRFRENLARLQTNEEGHAIPAVAALIGGVGAIILGIGAANDSGGLAIAGGIVAAVGMVASSLLDHMKIDYDVFGRLEKLEKK